MSSPIIFEKGTRDFSTLGLGLLSDAIQATTTEELNGQFIFEMDYPVSGNNADLIKENRIIVVNSGHILKRQGFIIRQIVRKIDLTMTIYAEHVSYATLDVALAPVGTISGDAKTALENWKRMLVPAVDFTVDSDILTTNSTSIGAPEFETARQGLGGHVGSILDVWGGEYQFDNWHIRLLKQRGKSANAIIAYGRNLISFEQDTNIADTYTSVYPYYQENSGDDGNKTHFLPERTVDSEFVGKYPNPKVLMLDLSNKFKDVADYSENKLRNYALSYIQSNNIGVPKVNMKISTVDLSRATGGFSEDIDLGDTVNVYFEKLGITTSAKVIKAVWNVLSDDYDKFEIGARRASLTESISELATTADENANKALNQALVALQSADGKSTIYYLNSSDPWPTNPNENDTAFVKDGENSIMYRYMFNNDTGMFSWVKILDSMSADQIKQRVSDALESGKAYSDQLVADNVAQVNAVLDDVQAKQADLTAQQAELDTKAQGYANKALADAKADTLATATQTAKDASDALAKAKTDLTTSLNKEVTDRTKAVSDLDTKAQGYATQAKTDAIATANGAVAKEVTDRQKAITDLDAKSTGAINQAKTDAQSALDALQVGGRNLVLNSATPHTGTGTNSTNNTQSNFNYPLSGGETTGSLYTKWGVNSPYTVSFDWSITGATVAGTFQTLWNNAPYGLGGQPVITVSPTNTSGHVSFTVKVLSTWAGTSANGVWLRMDNLQGTLTLTNFKLEIGNKATDYTQAPEDIVLDYTTKDNVISQSLTQYQATNDGKVTKAQSDATQALGLVATKVSQTTFDTKTGDLDSKYTAVKQTADQASTDIVAIKSTNTSQDTKINTLTSDVSGTKQSISDIQTEQGAQSTKINTIQTDVSGTKQDISDIQDANGVQDGKIASISTTVDGLSSSFSTYKTTNDGKVAKAQADIIVNANAITQKVSQSDYNAKTGDLTTKVNTAQSTADSATSTIGAYKTSNDARVASAESKITANATAITSKVSQSDYNTKTGQIDGQISTINQTAGQISQSVSNVKAQVDGLSVGGRNLYLNTKALWTGGIGNNGSKVTLTLEAFDSTTNMWHLVAPQQAYNNAGIYFYNGAIQPGDNWALSFDVKGTGNWSSNGARIENSTVTKSVEPLTTSWARVSSTGKKVSAGGAVIFYFDLTNSPLDVYIKLPKLEYGNMPTSWSPAPEDTDNKISTVSQTVDSISSIVSDQTTGLTKRVQTAEGTLSQVTGADIPALQKATYWQAPNGYDLNTYLTQGSTFFRDTTARTNAPTTLTKWMYLVVERTPNGDRVTQTAWYDTQTDAKITYRRQYDGKWGAWYANDNNSVASIAQTNGAIKTEISNRQTGDTNTLTQAKDFTTSSISNSESGMRSLITQTSDSIIAKVDTKTDSATVLSLLKDNWSIGIADNAGAITNGIVGNSTNMSLISNNVVINAPSTQIKGTAWINSAMIANGAIGKAQIGDASIDTAKIASLDVAKLTGNVSSFIQSNWNGVFASTMIDNTGMSINGGNTTTKFDTSGAHYSNGSGISATYSFGKWSDQSGNATSSTGLYLGATGSENSFINILGTNGAAALVLAGTAMDFGSNLNVLQGALNAYVNVNIRERLMFKANRYVGGQPSYIEVNEINRTFNFFTGGGSGTNKDYFYFNQNVISAGTFSSTSVLSKKNVKSVYDEDALGEIAKTQLVNFEYKNRPDQNHVSPIIDDVNDTKEYYIPKTVLGQDGEYVDMYTMISMAWKALQQVNDRLEKLESR
ncbi:phage tail spike protein [Leuconostoc lactis]|uniref:phage tail spike protein n=1 Tax=Leuconostoc lactis TaxID=1246 RepID=UPI000497F247|nr:phage tail spike protein [Leuconostoc lactis]